MPPRSNYVNPPSGMSAGQRLLPSFGSFRKIAARGRICELSRELTILESSESAL